mgnify:CR=1 FL=1
MPAYHLIFPMLEIEFLGRIAYLRRPLQSDYVVKIGKKDNEKYLTVNSRVVPRSEISGYDVNVSDALHAITTYIANHLKRKFVRGKGFFDRSKPIYQRDIHVFESTSTLKIYRGFIADYYVVDPQSIRRLRVSIVPAFEFELTKPLSEILWENMKKGLQKELLVDELGGIDLNTIENYWKRNIGPKYAGRFVDICLPGDPEHRKKIKAIEKYYRDKGKLRDIAELNPKFRSDIIVIVEKKRNGEKKPLDYLGSLVVLTPNMEVLSTFLNSRELDDIHKITRPRNRDQLKQLLREAANMYVENLPPLVKVKENAIMA